MLFSLFSLKSDFSSAFSYKHDKNKIVCENFYSGRDLILKLNNIANFESKKRRYQRTPEVAVAAITLAVMAAAATAAAAGMAAVLVG